MTIHWYPGHIAKAERKLKEQLGLVDVVLEVLDARIPISSRYETLNNLIGEKPKLIILNKSDIADPVTTTEWKKYFAENLKQKVVLTSASSARDISTIVKQAAELGKPAIEKLELKGLLPRPIRVMVVGMPNVGKSSIINKLVKTAKTKTGEKAGVTRRTQWVRINPKIELMDTPGIIPMRLENQERAMRLAIVNSVGEAAYDRIETAKALARLLFKRYKEAYCAHYKVETDEIDDVAISRKFILSGGYPDTDRTASLVLSDFRKGRIGRMSLEDVSEIEN